MTTGPLFTIAAGAALAACAPVTANGIVTPSRPANNGVRTVPPGPSSVVLVLDPGTPTAIMHGPFMVTAINPGSNLKLAVAAKACDEPGLLWFDYSGAGVAVGGDQLLCALSQRTVVIAHAFSGRSEPAPAAQ